MSWHHPLGPQQRSIRGVPTPSPVGLLRPAATAMGSSSRGVPRAVRAWLHHPKPVDLTEQWQNYLGLCGTWHGTWQRLSVEGPSLKSAQRFRATCAPCVAADGESVHHVNRYPPEVAPKPGLLGSDGMMEVDFGQMNKSNFLQPFGPRSSASYGSGWAALYPSSWQTERLAVELISRVGAQRHRLIAMWQRKDEDVALTMLTSIRESQADGSERVFGTGSSEHGEEHVAEQVEEDWYTLSPSTFALVPRQLSSSGDFQIGLAWATASDDAWNGLIANFSQHLQSVQLPK
ncbi:unnamed protein product [Durusdinium trenchii]|uniref:DUF3598 domain-containing protein n=1 Tax=Durusdinium trenchii TaxID=1381693 RepID=A0ABP0MUP3_9DINO